MKTLKSTYRFFLHPDKNFVEAEFYSKVKLFFRIFLCNFIILLLSTIPIGLLRISFNIHPVGLDLPFYKLMLINILFIPILEESAFRLSLVYKRINLLISLMIIVFIFSSYLYSRNIFSTEGIVLRLTLSLVSGLSIFSILQYKRFEKMIVEFWEKEFSKIFYVFLFLFVLRHLDQYDFSLTTLPILLIILFPQFVTGVFLSFTRIRLGFAYAVFLHGVWNSLSMTILFALQ